MYSVLARSAFLLLVAWLLTFGPVAMFNANVAAIKSRAEGILSDLQAQNFLRVNNVETVGEGKYLLTLKLLGKLNPNYVESVQNYLEHKLHEPAQVVNVEISSLPTAWPIGPTLALGAAIAVLALAWRGPVFVRRRVLKLCELGFRLKHRWDHFFDRRAVRLGNEALAKRKMDIIQLLHADQAVLKHQLEGLNQLWARSLMAKGELNTNPSPSSSPVPPLIREAQLDRLEIQESELFNEDGEIIPRHSRLDAEGSSPSAP